MIDPVTIGVGAVVVATVGRGRQALARHREMERGRRQLQLQRDEQLRYQRARLELHDQIIQAVHDVGAEAYRFQRGQR